MVETGGGGADGGVDLVLTKPGKGGGEKFLVQCKQWRALNVGVDVVRELYGVMAARGATGGFVVTAGRLTDDAISFASGRNVVLVDGPKLVGLIRQAKAGPSSPRRARLRPTPPRPARPRRRRQPAPCAPSRWCAVPRSAAPMWAVSSGAAPVTGMLRYATDRLKPGPLNPLLLVVGSNRNRSIRTG